MKKKPLIYLLYGGSSVDGMGPGEYRGATFSKTEAMAFWRKEVVGHGSYSTGSIKPVLQDKIDYIHSSSNPEIWDQYS